jgi:hypothetical protein
MSPNDFAPFDVCDAEVTTGSPAMRNVLFVDDDYATVAGQRVYVAGSADDAHRLLDHLSAAIRGCAPADQWSGHVDSWTDLDLAGIGEEAVGWSYRLGFVTGARSGQHDSVYVALARVGSVVTEILRREPTGSTDPGPQTAEAFAGTGVQRLTDRLPSTITGTSA